MKVTTNRFILFFLKEFEHDSLLRKIFRLFLRHTALWCNRDHPVQLMKLKWVIWVRMASCKNRPRSEVATYYLIFILNQILIHILHWMTFSWEIDHLIIHHNKRAGESKHPSWATSSQLRRRSFYINQRLMKHDRCAPLRGTESDLHTPSVKWSMSLYQGWNQY